jgi:WD40 repeat protein
MIMQLQHNPFCVIDCCCCRVEIPVELRIIIRKYLQLKTELSLISSTEGHGSSEAALVLSEQDNRLYSASPDSTIRIWDIVSNICVAILKDHDRPVTCLFSIFF